MGTWILSPFAGLAYAAAASQLTGIAPHLGRFAGWGGAAALGPALASYTAVLLADTAIPAWHEARGELPVLFVGSAAAAGSGAALIIASVSADGMRENGPAVRLGALGAAVELVAGRVMEERLDRLPGGIGEVYRDGRAGRWNQVAHALTAVGGIGALLARRSRIGSAAAGIALAAGSLATRFAVFEASASRPQLIPSMSSHHSGLAWPSKIRRALRDLGSQDGMRHGRFPGCEPRGAAAGDGELAAAVRTTVR